MEIRIFEAGKPAKQRSVDANFDLESGKLSIGGAAPCEVVVPGLPAGAQAEIHVDGARVEIRNVASGEVSVAGRAVGAGSALALGAETLISVGGKELVFRSTPSKGAGGGAAAAGEKNKDRPSYLAKDMLKEVFQVLCVPEDHPALVVHDAEDKVVKRLDLAPPQEEATIGRHPENRLVLYHPSVSKNHARVVRDGVGFLVMDLGSRNGIELNGQRVQDRARLKSGDRIKIGAFTIKFVDPKAAVESLSGSVPDLKKIEAAKPGEKVVVGYDEKENPKGFFHQTSSGEGPKVDEVKAVAAAAAKPTPPSGEASPPEIETPGTSPLVFVLIAVGLAIFGAAIWFIWKAMGEAA